MKKLIYFILPGLLAASCSKDDVSEWGNTEYSPDVQSGIATMVVKTTQYGKLSKLIGDYIYDIDSLVVEGPVDAEDFKLMRQGTLEGRLAVINLEGAVIKDDRVPENALIGFVEDPSSNYPFESTYYKKSYLRRVILPGSLKVIGKRAFYNAFNLERVNLPQSLAVIEDEAFSMMLNLEGKLNMPDIELPESLDTIGKSAFSRQRGVCGKFKVPKGIVIDESGFAETGITEVEIPEECEIGRYAFRGSMVFHIKWPDKIPAIGNYAFADCRFVELIIPDNLPETCGGLFSGNELLTKVSIPKSWKRLPGGFLNCCINLEDIDLPDNIEELGGGALRDTGIRKIEFPEGFKKLGSCAISGCQSLEYIYLPSTFNELGDQCCSDLPALKAIYCKAIEPPFGQFGGEGNASSSPFFSSWIGTTSSGYHANRHAEIYVPRNSIPSYRKSVIWNYFYDFRPL